MKEGNYKEAIRLSIQEYQDNIGVGFDENGNPNSQADRTDTFDRYKPGILDALEVHKELGMIDEDDFAKLMTIQLIKLKTLLKIQMRE